MSKATARIKTVKKPVEKIRHGILRTNTPADVAAAGPPLGSMFGQKGINIAAFCKDLNELTQDIKEGMPLPCRVSVNPDRSYELVIHKPLAVYFLKQAAGIQRDAKHGREEAGKITLKYIYEIALIKKKNYSSFEIKSIQEIQPCSYVLDTPGKPQY